MDTDQKQLEDLNEGKALLPKDPKIRAHSRLWTDHVSHPSSGIILILRPQQTSPLTPHPPDQPPHRPRILPVPSSPRFPKANRRRRRPKTPDLQTHRRGRPFRPLLPRPNHLLRRHPNGAVGNPYATRAEAVPWLAGSRARHALGQLGGCD